VIAGIAAGCILLVVLVGAAVAVATRSTSGSATSPPSGVGKAVQAPGSVVYFLSDYSVSGGNDASQPQKGYEYIVTHWLVTNRGGSPLKVKPQDFVAISGGQTRPAETNVSLGGKSLLHMSIPVARVARGVLVFQIKLGDSLARVQYRSGKFTGEWNVPG
jgi:hypothetical protein